MFSCNQSVLKKVGRSSGRGNDSVEAMGGVGVGHLGSYGFRRWSRAAFLRGYGAGAVTAGFGSTVEYSQC